jgi:aminomethyltransferase
MNHVALEDQHIALGGKMVPFAGFNMPVQYSSIIEEHLHVRKAVGVFDVSHMGEFILTGKDAEKWLNHMTLNNVAALEVGQVQYSAMLYDDGGIVDDLLVYRFPDHYMIVVNASNIEKDFEWLSSHMDGDVSLRNISDQITLLAIQGPRAAELVKQFADIPVDDVVYYHFRQGHVDGVPVIYSRTGYTGEDGFEIYIARAHSMKLWNAVWDAGRPLDLKPIGLGARDSLRLEVCYCLYGNDIDNTTTPHEAGLGWITKMKKPGGFLGIDPVTRAKDNPKRKLMGFVLNEKGIARQHSEVYLNGTLVGEVTSGGFAPMLNQAVGLAYIAKPHDVIGNKIEVDVRGRRFKATLVETPFHKKHSG